MTRTWTIKCTDSRVFMFAINKRINDNEVKFVIFSSLDDYQSKYIPERI